MAWLTDEFVPLVRWPPASKDVIKCHGACRYPTAVLCDGTGDDRNISTHLLVKSGDD